MIFLFGATSMVGWSIYRSSGLADLVPFCNGFTRGAPPTIDRGIHLDDPVAVYELFAAERPPLIIHCAGVCDVEKCEESPEFAFSVNVDGMQLLLDHAPAETRIVYCSSDHVFSGDSGPYWEDSPTDPVSVYGRTRVAAEKLLLARGNGLVIRTGPWIGPSATGKNGHLDWLRYRHGRGLPMTVVSDEQRSVIWAEEAARRVAALAQSQVTGIRHLTVPRAVPRPELAHHLNAMFGIGATFELQLRRDRGAPHPGAIELRTRHSDPLAAPLSPVVP